MANIESIQLHSNLSDSDSDESIDNGIYTRKIDFNTSLSPPHSPISKAEATSSEDPHKPLTNVITTQSGQNLTFKDVADQYIYNSISEVNSNTKQSMFSKFGLNSNFRTNKFKGGISPPIIHRFGSRLLAMRTPWKLRTNEMNGRNNALEISAFLRVLERISNEYLLINDVNMSGKELSQCDSNLTYGLDEFFNSVYSKVDFILPKAEGKWKYDKGKTMENTNSVNTPVSIGGNVYHLKDFGLEPGKNFHQRFAIWDINLDSPNLCDEHGELFNNQILSFKMHPLGFPCLNYILSITNSLLFWLKLDEENHFAVINYPSLNYTSLLIMACAALALNKTLSFNDIENAILSSLDWRGKCKSSYSNVNDKSSKKCISMEELKDNLSQCALGSSQNDEHYTQKIPEKCLNFFPDLEREEEKRLNVPKKYHSKIAQEYDGLYPISLWPPSHRRYLEYFKRVILTPLEKLPEIQMKPFLMEKMFFTNFFQTQAFQANTPSIKRFTKSFLSSARRTTDDFFSIEIYELDFYHKMVRTGEFETPTEPNLYHSQQFSCSHGRYKPLLFPDTECGAPFEPREANSYAPGIRLKCCIHDYNVIGVENNGGSNTGECIPVAIDFLHDREGNDKNLVIAGDVVICLIGHTNLSTRQIIATYSFNTSFASNENSCIVELQPVDFDLWSQHNWRLHGYGLRECMDDFGLKSKNSKSSLINPNGRVSMVLRLLDTQVFAQPMKALNLDETSTSWSKSISKLKSKLMNTSVLSTFTSLTPTGACNRYLPPSISYQVSTPDKLPSLTHPFPSIADYLVSHIVPVGEQSVVFLSEATHVAPEKCLVALKIFQSDYVESLKFVKTYFKDITRTDTVDEAIIDTVKYKSKEDSKAIEAVETAVRAKEGDMDTDVIKKTSLRELIRRASKTEKEMLEKLDAEMLKKLDKLERLEKLEKDLLNLEKLAKIEELEREKREALEKYAETKRLIEKMSSREEIPTSVSTIQVPTTDSKGMITITHKEGSDVTATVSEAKAVAMAADAKAAASALSKQISESKAPAEIKAVVPEGKPPAEIKAVTAETKLPPPPPTSAPSDAKASSAPKSKMMMKKGKGKKMMAPPKKLLPVPKPTAVVKTKSPFGFKLHWKPISGKKLEDSIFNNLETDDRKGIIDTSVVKRLFSRVKEDGNAKEEKVEVKEKKDPAVTIFDHRRAQNLAILLRADYPLDILVEMLENLRVTGIPVIFKPEPVGPKKIPTALDIDLIVKLKQACPTSDEVEAFKDIEKDPVKVEKLRDIEKKMMPLVKVKMITQKLRVCEFTTTFLNRIEEGMGQLNVHLTACNDVLTNKQLPIFMAAVLEWGNFVNHGSFEFVTKGFALSSAARLADFKSLDQSLSSLHYLLVNLCVKFPALTLETMTQNLSSVFEAQRTPTNSISEIMNDISSELNFCKNFYKQVQSAENGAFGPEFSERLSLILAEGEKAVGNLNNQKTHVHDQILRVWDYLGEEWKSQDPLENIFDTLWHLLKTVEKSFEDIAKKPDKYLVALQCPHEQTKLRNIFLAKGKKTKVRT